MASEVYDKVNTAWKDTCRLLFGRELGELKEYRDWLLSNVAPPREETSHVSGEKVYLGSHEYCNGRFMGLSEVDFKRRFEPLNINEIKDIDSAISALGERFVYTGDIILGNSRFIERSANIFETHYAYESNNIDHAKYIAYCSNVKEAESLFGCNTIGETKFSMKNYETFRISGSFELWKSSNTSGSHFVFGLDGCADCMFSFNLQNAKYCIGNIPLGKGKYEELKRKLLSEVADGLGRNKRFSSILDLAKESLKDSPGTVSLKIPHQEDEKTDKGAIEDVFGQITSVVLGRKLTDMDSYSDYFLRYTWKMDKEKSCVSKKPTWVVHYASLETVPRNRLLKWDESFEAGKVTSLAREDLVSVDSISKNLHKIAFFCIELASGENRNIIDTSVYAHCMNAYRSSLTGLAKNNIFSTWTRRSNFTIGSVLPYLSDFVINTYYSSRITRGFEVDGSRDCTDIYFSHNCEAVQDGLFCFNAKNLRRAIGNAEYPPDEYKKFKGSLLGQISSELEKNKTLKWDIYNIRCGK